MHIKQVLTKKIDINFENLKPASITYNETVDECEVHPHICGPEAGCHDTIDGYLCLCTSDLSPVDPIYGCDRKPASSKFYMCFIIEFR
ncbi:hypothetical protein B4U80_14962 [Leptotrombidium deliense]|uniref:EGF-like domain-containing protein n=1 Tax=Leptotrombidium deliense TaxID=299467 RepID=A0A443RWD1_9ACAR|nr:hypothetical protein B4U80_14962 [Leptotrombidium deliense]